MQCSGSVQMELRYPEPDDSEASREGTAAHWVALDQWTQAGLMPAEGSAAPNGVIVTREMIEGAEVLKDAIEADLASVGLGFSDVAIEVRVSMSGHIHARVWGTPDARAWTQKFVGRPGHRLKLFVWDYKFGFGVVEAFECWQGVDYVAGCLNTVPVESWPNIDVEFVIVQPRAPHPRGPVRRWRLTAEQLRPYIARSSAAVHEAFSDQAKLVVGPECENCSARHACPALQAAGSHAMHRAFAPQPHDLQPAQRAVELRFLRRAQTVLKARVSGLEAEIEADLKRGAAVPGWRLAQGIGRTVWNQPDDRVIDLGHMLGLDLAKPAEALTPKQAVKAGLPEQLLKTYAIDKHGAMHLVEDDGSRARSVFGRS